MSRSLFTSKKQIFFPIFAIATSMIIFLTPLKAPSAAAADPVPVLFAQIDASDSFDSEAPFRAVMGSTLFFAGKYTPAQGQQLGGVTNDVGRELWKTDGTNVSLVKDLNLGAGSSNPSHFTVAGQILYFLAGDGIIGENDNGDDVNLVRDLWKTDGVTTTLVRESSSLPTNPTSMTAVGDVLYFVADDVGLGRELWKVTPNGMVSVIDVFSGQYGSDPAELTAVGETIFFIALGDNDGSDGSLTGRELWKSDGSTTEIVKDIRAGIEGSSPKELTELGSTLYFAADDRTGGDNNEELWKSDGTSDGTVKVSSYLLPTPDINNIFTFKNDLYFSARDADKDGGPQALWKSDGTEDGTTPVAQVEGAINFKVIGDYFYFQADYNNSGDLQEFGNELWVSDGTSGGTKLVKDIDPGNDDNFNNSNPEYLTAVSDTLFFSANVRTLGRELWVSDGTEPGTKLVKDFDTEEGQDGEVSGLITLGNSLYFAARTARTDAGSGPIGLWKLTKASVPSGGSQSSGSSYNPPTAALPSTGSPITAKSKIVRFTSFAPNRSQLSSLAKIGISRTVRSFAKAKTVVCTGLAVGSNASAFSRRIADERARNACNLVKRLSPSITTKVKVSLVSGGNSNNRGVLLKITGE